MRKNLLLLVLAIVMMGMFTSAWAQTEVTLGTQVVQSGTSGIGPTNYYWEARRIQWVFTAAEIIAAGGIAGNITSLAYDVSQVAGGNLVNYKVKMAHTSATDAATHNTATLTTVKNAHAFTPGAIGWRTIEFDSAFEWDGVSNILFDVSWGVNSGYSSTGQVWLYNNVANQMRGVTSGSTSVENTNTSSTRSGKPRAKLVITAPAAVTNPTLFSALPISPYQINLGWTPNAESNNVMIAYNTVNTFGVPVDGTPYSVDGSIPGGGTVVYSGSGSTFEHTGLNGNTQYFYRAWSVDGSDTYSTGVSANATTLLPPISTFPWTESFDGATFAPAGWRNIKTAGITEPGIWTRQTSGTNPTATPFSGAGMAMYNMFSIQAGGKAELVTPQLDLPGDNYRVRFYMYRDDGYLANVEGLNVYFNTTNSSTGGTLLGTVHRSISLSPIVPSNGWYEYNFNLPEGSAGNGRHIIIEGFSAYGNNMYIDDVSVLEILPVAPNPVTLNFPLDNLTTFNNPRLSWTAATTGEPTTKYNVYINDELVAEDITTNFFQTTGLLAGETYTWKVEPGNVNGYNADAVVRTFNTVNNGYLAESFEATTIPAGWSNVGTWATSTSAFYHGSRSISKFTTATHNIMGTPLLTIVPGSKLEFFARTTATSTFQRIQIKTSTDGTTWVDFGDPIVLASNAPFAFYSIDLDPLAGGSDLYLGFAAYFAAGGSGGTIFVDHVIGPMVTPLRPNAVTLSSPANNATSIGILPTLTWTPAATGGVPTGYKIYCDTDENPSTLITTHTTTSYTFTNPLLFGRDYYWNVVATNSVGDAEASATRKFSTATGIATSPSPANNATNVNATSRTLGWTAVTGASGYKVKVGTTSGASDVADMVSVATNSYTHPVVWQYSTQYFWTVYTMNGEQMVTGTEWNFTTQADPTIYPPHLQNFTGTFPPTNWTRHDARFTGSITTGNTGFQWESDDWLNGPSTNKAAKINIYGSTRNGWFVTPPISINADNLELKFDLGLVLWNNTTAPTTTNADDRFLVLISDSNTFSQANVVREWNNTGSEYVFNEISATGTNVSIPLSGYSGNIFIAFYGESTVGENGDNDLMIDNFRVLPLNSEATNIAGGNANVTPPTVNGINPSVEITGLAGTGTVAVTTAYNPAGVSLPNVGLSLTLSGTSFGGSTITINHGLGFAPLQIAYRILPGGWNLLLPTDPSVVAWTDMLVTFTLDDAKADGDLQIVFPQDDSQTLPVELSSFTAVLTAELFVNIAWVAESETNHLGYNLLRSQERDLETAIKINASMLNEGTSVGSQTSYLYTDMEVYDNSVYYYWLESVAIDGSTQFAGPITVTIGQPGVEPPVPVIPIATVLMNAYPNPFNPQTNLRYSLREAGDVRIDVYNTKGQHIRSFNRSHSLPGYYSVVWDGKDNAGKLVGSGVYFYRMTSGKYSATRKMMLMK